MRLAILPNRSASTQIATSAKVLEATELAAEVLLQQYGSSQNGLSEETVARRFEEFGPNSVAEERRHVRLKLFFTACTNPLVILLLVLAALSFATEDPRAGTVMLAMVVLGVVLRFVQESRADDAAAKLKAMITATATVVPDSQPREVPLAQLVPGDIGRLAAGDMIPADVRLIACKDLFVVQSSLTGESMPGEKFAEPERSEGKGVADFRNICFLGTSVESGSGTAVVIET